MNDGADHSWRLKLRRAHVHFDELERRLAPLRETHEYTVGERLEKQGVHNVWTYRLYLAVEPDPYVAVVLGDLLFNVRSALDHLAVAHVPRDRERSASFPICTVDPERAHPGDERGDADRLKAWATATAGMPARILDIVRAAQPFNAKPPAHLERLVRLGPQDQVLAVLSAFQNADKHRRLITFTEGLDLLTVRLRAVTVVRRMHDQPAIRSPVDGKQNARAAALAQRRRALPQHDRLAASRLQGLDDSQPGRPFVPQALAGCGKVRHLLDPSTSADSALAISASRPCAACW